MHDDARPEPREATPRKLFLISFSILFLELASIRWLSSSVPVLAYFNNLILISCFFGLGVGCLLAGRRLALVRFYPAALLVLVLAVLLLEHLSIAVSYREDVLFFVPQAEDFGIVQVSAAALAGFLINVLFFALLGQELGRQLAAVENPLRAYAWDIGGSLAGVIAYSLCSALGTPPHTWYAISGLLLLVFLVSRKEQLAALATIAVALALMVLTYGEDVRWSPYYKVEAHPYDEAANAGLGTKILVDGVRIQDALRFGPELVGSPLWKWIPYYQLPYHLVAPKKVLVLGAGSGNEVVMALLAGAEEVHAVEIDPVIADYGRTLHPNRPYASEKVTVHVDDARSFISSTDERFDLIVISALDSHKQIAGMSSLRLESFFYTAESFARMRRLLTPDGVFCLNMITLRPWTSERIYWSLTEAFGEKPRLLTPEVSPLPSIAFVYGAAAVDLRPDWSPVFDFVPEWSRGDEVRLATDNWPYLYLEKNRVPWICAAVLGAMLVLATAIVVTVEPAVRRPNLHFFFLGAGFMLLETRSITQMALLFGTTWHVNAIVFAAVLATILVTNLMVLKEKAPGRSLSYALLLATLVLGYFFPFASLLELARPARLLIAVVVIGLPIVWASFIFSRSFRHATRVETVFGSNLLGIVFGGAVEYLSNVWGLDVLYLIALVLYLASLAFLGRRPAEA